MWLQPRSSTSSCRAPGLRWLRPTTGWYQLAEVSFDQRLWARKRCGKFFLSVVGGASGSEWEKNALMTAILSAPQDDREVNKHDWDNLPSYPHRCIRRDRGLGVRPQAQSALR